LNTLNLPCACGQWQKDSTRPRGLCFNAITVWLEKKYQLHKTLPDYFSQELNLNPVDDPEENLKALAKRHKELSGTRVNWLGTYLHAAQVWQKGLEYKKA
jgi:hypothetical protein